MIRCIVRGGGDLATGVVWRLNRAGCAVVVTELAHPLAIRRAVSVSSAIAEGQITIDGLVARRVETWDETWDEAWSMAGAGEVAVIASERLPADHRADVVVDARMAKKALDTSPNDASLVIALGPGFEVGVHCHAIVETMRGHDLGRVIWEGRAIPDTGVPGVIGGQSHKRIVRAPANGQIKWEATIGQIVADGEVLGHIGTHEVVAHTAGVVRGLISPSTAVTEAMKVGDVDPRAEVDACFSISDKALSIGGGVVEVVTSRWPLRA